MSDSVDYNKVYRSDEPVNVGYVITLLLIFATGLFGVIPLVLRLCTGGAE